MEREENVYEESGTAHTAEAEVGEGATVPGKFKDVNALVEAYGALQAEFTRRSQRLRALEKAMENSERKADEADNADGEKNSTTDAPPEQAGGSIDPRKSAETEPVACPMPQYEVESTDSEKLYEAAKQNEGVRLKIIGDYLSSLKNSGAPVMKGGTGTPAVSLKKPKSLEEAGQMALRFFKDKA